MEQKVLCSLDGVSVYGIISILIFVVFFAITLGWAFTLKRTYLNHMGDLPLDDEEKPADPSNPETL